MNAVETALYSFLAGQTGITSLLSSASSIYNPDAPQGAAYPFLIFWLASGAPDNETPHESHTFVYGIKAVSNNSLKEAGSIDAAVQAAFLGQNLTNVSGYSPVQTQREGSIRFEEVAGDSRRYWHAGALYRFRITT